VKGNIYVTNFGSNGSPGNTVTRVSTTSNVPDVAFTLLIPNSVMAISDYQAGYDYIKVPNIAMAL
jgi:hypothetical protein